MTDVNDARRIAVVGAGYVGTTVAACFAALGHRVTCADADAEKVARLRRGEVDIQEPGLAELVAEGLASGRLRFVVDARAAIAAVDGAPVEAVFVCVPTPMLADGSADLSAVTAVVTLVRESLPPGCVVVTKSTVPVGTAARIQRLVNRPDVAVVSNPEFLREGSAVEDFLHPDRVVVGCDRAGGADALVKLYGGLDAPIMVTDTASAELVKYAANCFLAVKLSYVNTLAELCERVGADIVPVSAALGADTRIGPAFTRPGPGWGGSCLPKDTAAFRRICADLGVAFPLLDAAVAANEHQRQWIVDKIRTAVGGSLAGKRIGLLGLAFKAGTNDLRDSPALAVAGQLAAEGAELTGYDPAYPTSPPELTDPVRVVNEAPMVAKDADALVVLTDWPQFRALDWAEMARLAATAVVIDARNLLDPEQLRRAGYEWIGLGRPAPRDVPDVELQHARVGQQG